MILAFITNSYHNRRDLLKYLTEDIPVPWCQCSSQSCPRRVPTWFPQGAAAGCESAARHPLGMRPALLRAQQNHHWSGLQFDSGFHRDPLTLHLKSYPRFLSPLLDSERWRQMLISSLRPSDGLPHTRGLLTGLERCPVKR